MTYFNSCSFSASVPFERMSIVNSRHSFTVIVANSMSSCMIKRENA